MNTSEREGEEEGEKMCFGNNSCEIRKKRNLTFFEAWEKNV